MNTNYEELFDKLRWIGIVLGIILMSVSFALAQNVDSLYLSSPNTSSGRCGTEDYIQPKLPAFKDAGDIITIR